MSLNILDVEGVTVTASDRGAIMSQQTRQDLGWELGAGVAVVGALLGGHGCQQGWELPRPPGSKQPLVSLRRFPRPTLLKAAAGVGIASGPGAPSCELWGRLALNTPRGTTCRAWAAP